MPRARILGRAVALPDLPWLGLTGPLVGPEDAGDRGRLREYAAAPAGRSGAMRRAAIVLALAFAAAAPMPAGAKDLGVRGETWPIAEPDLLAEIEARLTQMQRSGEI